MVTDVSDAFNLLWLTPKPQGEGMCDGVYCKSTVMKEADIFTSKYTKLEIDAILDELRLLLENSSKERALSDNNSGRKIQEALRLRVEQLEKERDLAPSDIFSATVESHKILCDVKQMGEKEAYGQDPAFYYGSAISGEAGEMVNKMIKALRNGGDATNRLFEAVVSELPDICIYSFVLAYVLDIDLTHLVSEKAKIVIQRAKNGYYGGPLVRTTPDCT